MHAIYFENKYIMWERGWHAIICRSSKILMNLKTVVLYTKENRSNYITFFSLINVKASVMGVDLGRNCPRPSKKSGKTVRLNRVYHKTENCYPRRNFPKNFLLAAYLFRTEVCPRLAKSSPRKLLLNYICSRINSANIEIRLRLNN